MYGTQKCVLSIVGNLDPARYRAVVAAPPSEMFFSALAAAGAEAVPLPFSGLADLKTISGLRAVIKQHQIRVVHAHLGISSFLTIAATAGSPDVSVICTRHFINDRYTSIQNRIAYSAFRKMYSFMNGRFKKITFPSEAIRKAVEAREGFLGDKAVVIPNSVRIRDFAPDSRKGSGLAAVEMGLPPGRPLALCVSRLAAEKNVEDLILAAAKLKSAGVEINYIVAGEGNLKARLEEMIKAHGLENNFRLPGYVKNVGELLTEADMFVLCSREEPFGIAVLEAMAAGTPVVCAESGGPAEIIQNNVSGLFFRPGDAAHLAEKIAALADSPALCESLREGAFKRAMLYDDAAIAERFMALYDETRGRNHG